MVEMNNLLQKTAVLNALRTCWIGRSFHYFDTIPSTNTALKAEISQQNTDSLPAGTVYLTEYQSHGRGRHERGRFNRRWDAPPRTSLLFSTLFRPDWPAEQMNWLTMIAGLAAVEAIESIMKNGSPLTVQLKWPNDIMILVDGEWCKAGGILVEGELDANGRLQTAVLGIGLNVNIQQSDLPEGVTPATSLLVATGQPIPRLPLLVTLLQKLERYYETAVSEQSPQPAWNQRLITLGQTVQAAFLHNDETPLIGIAESTDKWGQLYIRDPFGKLHTVTAGDVTLRNNKF